MATMQSRLADLIAALGADFKLKTVPIVFSAQGALTTRTGKSFVQLLGSGTIVAVKGYLDTPATGATTFKVDVNKNGTTIYGTQGNRPTWTASANAATVLSHSVTTFADGDRLSCDIDAIGSTVAGSDLTMTVYILRTGN
jgi:hypothetical protein